MADLEPIKEIVSALADGIIIVEHDIKTSQSSIKTLIKILKNIVEKPGEAKYRSLPLHNSGIQRRIVNVNGAEDILSSLGFTRVDGSLMYLPEETEALRIALEVLQERVVQVEPEERPVPTTTVDDEYEARMQEVRKRNAALKEKHRKEKEDKERLKKQMQAEQRERRDRPVQSSHAVSRTFGANAATFSDIGVDLNSGGG